MSAILENKDTTEARKWLESLDQEIWKICHGKMTTNMDGKQHDCSWGVVNRELTPEELAHIKKVAHLFIVQPENAGFGFNFGVTFYDHPPVVGVEPEPFFSVYGRHLPKGMDQEFDGAWEEFSPLSHNSENARLLAHYEMEELQEKSHYEY